MKIIFKKIACFFILLLFFTSFSFSAWNKINNDFKEYGDNFQIILPLYSFGYTIYKKDYKGTFSFIKVLSLAQSTTYLLKKTTNEKRPGRTRSREGFPSGHTMAAYAAVSFLDMRYNIETKYYLYTLAALVGISRVVAVKHYPHDVVAGAVVGYYSNKLLVKPYNKNDISFFPYYDGRKLYANLYLRF